jgi:hypothetical protein
MAAKVGQPTRFRPEMVERARALAEEGKTNPEIAAALDVSPRSMMYYQKRHGEFGAAVKAGKALSDQKVVVSLYQRACGYSHPETDIRVVEGKIVQTEIVKHYPPDPTSMIFWLKNRQPDKWQDRMELSGRYGKPLIPESPDPLEVARRVAFVFAQALAQQKKPPETITQERETA